MSAPLHFFECTPAELRAAVESVGLRGYVSKQLLEWVYRRGVTDLELMTNLSADTRDRIRGVIQFHRGVEVTAQQASDAHAARRIGRMSINFVFARRDSAERGQRAPA